MEYQYNYSWNKLFLEEREIGIRVRINSDNFEFILNVDVI